MLKLENLDVVSGSFKLQGVSFEIPKGDCLGLIGASGSGKTTLMEAICGLGEVSSGKVWIDGRDVTELTPAERNIGLVPQENVLFSHMQVAEQVGYGLRVRKWAKQQIQERVKEVAEALQIFHLLGRSSRNLSGGEAKRVAIARAMAFRPDLLCLDESFTGMDQATREAVIAMVKKAIEQEGVTTLLISHQPKEIESLATNCFEIKQSVF